MALLCVTLLCCSTGAGQEAVNSEPDVLDATRTSNCEFTSSALDNFVQGTDVTKKIIVLAYIGENETVKDVDIRRLHNAKTYVLEMYKSSRFGRPVQNIITGRATETLKEGQLDFYVDGRLKLSMRFLKDRDLNLSPCYIESGDYCKNEFKKMFYPCIGRR